MANRKYTKEFKDSTIQLALNSTESVLKIGADLDVNPKTIYNWIREYKIANNIPVVSIGKSTTSSNNVVKETQENELKRLRAENIYYPKKSRQLFRNSYSHLTLLPYETFSLDLT